MITREYECRRDGYFTVKRNVSDPTTESCPNCGRKAERIYTSFPTWGFGGVDNGIPNKTNDSKEYSEWQRDRLNFFTDALHPDNVGKSDPAIKRVTKKTASGKNR